MSFAMRVGVRPAASVMELNIKGNMGTCVEDDGNPRLFEKTRDEKIPFSISNLSHTIISYDFLCRRNDANDNSLLVAAPFNLHSTTLCLFSTF
jgi:hypothetical protein